MPESESRDDRNARIIAEFRSNHGKVGPPFEGVPMILVHHKGRRSGVERVNPLAYQPVEGGWAIFGSKGGAPTNPDWYLNLVAHPRTTVEVGDDTFDVVAREAQGEERERIFEEQKRLMPVFADYEAKAAPREIPVIVFEPAGQRGA
ncbi:MAG: nitroreductase family deazaflavin-dependent oxidoreductase [Acidimicrobiaceae bacterium]|nr:nitroreductase family deazaflavin-dependent oxidoreductase [Acidimicrobiaceae bacterium]MBO0747588.1 nitroreductase family deazaflavin-dependent oxidoreductase [Acidimicrobiaceae bacterium]